ncbi:MAG: hypothetical protein JJU45_15895 [Acidimicrobiia bacterium]|nr:hypothetical protein [Acidimicrobiia bacterium]
MSATPRAGRGVRAELGAAGRNCRARRLGPARGAGRSGRHHGAAAGDDDEHQRADHHRTATTATTATADDGR